MAEGFTVWLTGLSGAGKSTLATILASVLRDRGWRVEVLDEASTSSALSSDLGFSAEHRRLHALRLGRAAARLSREGTAVLIASTSPFCEPREAVRRSVPNFLEVFVRCPIEELIVRDPKGLYRKALRGEISSFPGVSEIYEAPPAPEVVVDREYHTVQEGVGRILDALAQRGYLSAPANGQSIPAHIAR